MKSRTKLFTGIIAIMLSVVLLFVTVVAVSNTSNKSMQVSASSRTIELSETAIDSQNILDEFDDAVLTTEGTITYFEGYKTIDYKALSEIDYIGDNDLEDFENYTVQYYASYDESSDIVSLMAIRSNGDGEILIDTIEGVAFINEDGEIDAIMEIEGESILLSEIQDLGLIQNCGWFKKLISAVVATVVVTAVVAISMATGGAALGAVIGTCAAVGAAVGGTTSAIVGAIDGEVSFGQICANFGAGLVVGAATGALTGLIVGKIACYNVAFSNGSFSSVNESIAYHFSKHGAEVGASNASQYVKMAMDTARTVIRTGATPIRAVAGATANVMRYEVGSYYIHMAIEGTKIIIVSFGLI